MILLRFVASTIHGTYAIAALSIGLQIEAISFMPGVAFGTGAMTLVGQNLGAGKPGRAKKNGLTATWIATIIMSCVGLLFYIFAEQIIDLFTESVDVIVIGGDYLRIMAYSQPFLALAMVFSGGLRGAGDTKTPLIYTIIHSWLVRIPSIYVLGFMLNLQTTGIWWAMTLSTVTQGLATWWKFQQGDWQKIEL
jgi:putative MATE family efflux protein